MNTATNNPIVIRTVKLYGEVYYYAEYMHDDINASHLGVIDGDIEAAVNAAADAHFTGLNAGHRNSDGPSWLDNTLYYVAAGKWQPVSDEGMADVLGTDIANLTDGVDSVENAVTAIANNTCTYVEPEQYALHLAKLIESEASGAPFYCETEQGEEIDYQRAVRAAVVTLVPAAMHAAVFEQLIRRKSI